MKWPMRSVPSPPGVFTVIGRMSVRLHAARPKLFRRVVVLGWLGTVLVLLPAGATEVPKPQALLPSLGSWFWHEREFEPEGYRPALDLFAASSPYTILTTSLRVRDKELTDPAVRAQISAAVEYAGRKGIGIAMDLDVRLAKEAFARAHPDELQEMLILAEGTPNATGNLTLSAESRDLSDHYTFAAKHYIPLAGRVVRVYSYRSEASTVLPETVRELSPDEYVEIEVSKDRVSIRVEGREEITQRKICLVAAITHLYPDVYSPHLDDFQKNLIASYRDIGLVGACKDEWGFPPDFEVGPQKVQYWFSNHRAIAYAVATGGRDLVRDFLLMTFGEKGKEAERQSAINTFMRMSTDRNGEVERKFYEAVKEILGATAMVATHPTWWPYPDRREFKKNGLDWWVAPRDWAQTDETTPYCCRTSLSKKWNSPVWFNMFYSPDPQVYGKQIWSDVLGGGRTNIHPVYPWKEERPPYQEYTDLLSPDLVHAAARIRLLDFISKSPLDCPVAVVFGHAGAMNWAGPGYDDVGVDLAELCWKTGFPADLIPSTEIGNGALVVSEDGQVSYGPQKYRAVVLYHPEFEPLETAAFFKRVDPEKTGLYRVGDWTKDFAGIPLEGNRELPAEMTVLSASGQDLHRLFAHLEGQGVRPITPSDQSTDSFQHFSVRPRQKGESRLLDGTEIFVAAEDNIAGDAISREIGPRDHPARIDAVGLVGLRVSAEGELQALAVGGLRRFIGLGYEVELPEPIDLAVWRNDSGRMVGVLQGGDGPIPEGLGAFTHHWSRLPHPK